MRPSYLLSLWLAALLVPGAFVPQGIAAEPEAPTPAVQVEDEEQPGEPAKEEVPAPATVVEQNESSATTDEEASATIQRDQERPRTEARRKRPRQREMTFRGPESERVEIGKDVVIAADEVVRELVVIAGNARVEGTVEGSLVVVSGSARINGSVGHDLVTVLGSATLGPNASVGRDAVTVGGALKLAEGAFVGGQQTAVALGPMLPDFTWLQNWLSKGVFLARPFPPGVRWVWMVAATCLLLYLAVTLVFPAPVRACVKTLEQQPVASFFVGLSLCVLLGPLLFLLVVSVAGLLVIPFLICAVIAAMIFGKIAVYTYTGQQLGRQFNSTGLSLPALLLLGAVLFYLIYMVPVLGFAVWGMVTLLGVGAVLLAAFAPFSQETQPALVGAGAGTPVAAPVVEGAGPGMAAPLPPAVFPSSDLALLPRVGFWRRFAATLLDFVLLMLLIRMADSWFLVLWAAYHVGMWAWKGTTIGGIVMGLKIVRLDGRPVDFGVALVRCLSSVFSAAALFLGFFWAGWDKDRQSWHDKIAGTLVVRMPKGVPLI